MNKIYFGDIKEYNIKDLPKSVRDYLEKKKNKKAFLESLTGYYLLNEGLKDFGYDSYEVIFDGRPKLDNNELYFNISHDKDMAVCVISTENIAVDIMKIRNIDERLLNYILNSSEKSPKDSYEFTKLWALKESYIKYKGESISSNMNKIDTTKIKYDIIDKNDYIVAICYGDKEK